MSEAFLVDVSIYLFFEDRFCLANSVRPDEMSH